MSGTMYNTEMDSIEDEVQLAINAIGEAEKSLNENTASLTYGMWVGDAHDRCQTLHMVVVEYCRNIKVICEDLKTALTELKSDVTKFKVQ